MFLRSLSVSCAKTIFLVLHRFIILDYVIEGGKEIELFQVKRPENSQYMIMEVMGMPSGKTIQVVRLTSKKPLKIVSYKRVRMKQGRGHEADVRVADISVSRNHAHLVFDKDRMQIYV